MPQTLDRRVPPISRRVAARWLARAFVCFVLTSAPWPGVRPAFSAALCSCANLLFDNWTFGKGGHARLRPAVGAELDVKESISTDTIVQVKVQGYSGELRFGLSARRDAHLPLALLMSVLLSAPLPTRKIVPAAAAGFVLGAIVSLGFLWLGVASFFRERLATVWRPARVVAQGLELANNLLLLPPANRFFLSLGIAVGIAWLMGRNLWRESEETVQVKA